MARNSYFKKMLFDNDSDATPVARYCDIPNCEAAGDYRAPKSRENLDDYYWFCLHHVRDYNQQWNYYDGCDQVTLEHHRRYDGVWQRPSWPLHHTVFDRKKIHAALREDPILGAAYRYFSQEEKTKTKKFADEKVDYRRLRALQVLGLAELPSDEKTLKRSYLYLVKRLHPDLNGGDPIAEEKLKEVNQAYQYLKKIF